jgi:glycosyltransferase involved in cell wall biosynthesis
LPTRAALTLGRIVVLPSRAESFPYVVLEAAAAGKPLIATNVGGIPEIFGPYADCLVPPDNAGALANGILTALEQPTETLAAAQSLRARVEAEFSIDTMVDAVLNSYQQARAASHRAMSMGDAHARPGLLS